MTQENSNFYMEEAIKLALKAYKNDDVPVGCVIVKDDKIIAKAYNKRHKQKNSIKHAEIIAIDKACRKLKRWILDDCTMYVTLEPCVMCAGALIQSRIKKVVYGAYEYKTGCCGSVMNIASFNNFNHKVEVLGGIEENRCSKLMKDFFKEIRQKNKYLK